MLATNPVLFLHTREAYLGDDSVVVGTWSSGEFSGHIRRSSKPIRIGAINMIRTNNIFRHTLGFLTK